MLMVWMKDLEKASYLVPMTGMPMEQYLGYYLELMMASMMVGRKEWMLE